jgi:hypothetical protein
MVCHYDSLVVRSYDLAAKDAQPGFSDHTLRPGDFVQMELKVRASSVLDAPSVQKKRAA